MPIVSFQEQPEENAVAAAYRPVVINVLASATDLSQVPPVVYCDIYFNDLFYKTLSKSQYKELGGESSVWQFDIQDAAQEYLRKVLGDFGEATITEATVIILKCLCKLRSSGYDSNGFILAEGTIPVQGTDSSDPVAGTGDSSNTFYILNATLQHEDNQDLVTHLGYFKNRVWDEDVYPLSHRPEGYKVGPNSSDMFPILVTGANGPSKIRVKYRFCGQTTFHSTDVETPTCIGPTFSESLVLPDAQLGTAYNTNATINGTAPFSLANVVKPTWMTILISGNSISFTGTPELWIAVPSATVSFDIVNCHESPLSFEDEIAYT